ncbi:MAG: sigma-54-dependent Fis family transcriptional regulator [Desulfobacterales bacterium]|nr:sigma-54-dependent Fis family transcriptional regulator [Desulfobacterales bacterium]
MKAFDILYVDDDRDILVMVGEYLVRAGYSVDVVDNGLDAFEMIKKKDYGLVFTDFKMPEFSGLDLLKRIKGTRPEVDVVIVTGHGTMESAIEAMKVGSYDYLQKPFKLDQLKTLIKNIQAKRSRSSEIVHAGPSAQRHRYGDLVGMSPTMRGIYDAIDSMRPTCPNVVIEGESGSGKELTARVIHQTGAPDDTTFVALNCQGMADKDYSRDYGDHLAGLMAGSTAATLFLNEVGDLPLAGQQVLLEMMQNGNGATQGDRQSSSRSRRTIATSCRSLSESVARGEFSAELLDVLAGASLKMPPLRERKEDICLLITRFLSRFNTGGRPPIAGVSFDALDVLLRYHWPGNVIQLENVIERAVALGVETLIDVEDLPTEIKTFNEISKIG